MQDKPVLLWIDATLSGSRAEFSDFSNFFAIRQASNSARELEDQQAARPDVLCFDFDYPDRAGLRLMEQIKRDHPSIPILMLTLQHSEKLAVWAFRAGVWDYFVKPVSSRDLERCLTSLSNLLDSGRNRFNRRSARLTPPIPIEARFAPVPKGEQRFMPAMAYIKNHFSEKISQKEVAKLCNMGQFRFSREFSGTFGVTFQEYLLRYRLREAQRLLANPHLAIVDVAFAVGFRDSSYFGRVFRKYYGCSPSTYRHKNEADNPIDEIIDELELAW